MDESLSWASGAWLGSDYLSLSRYELSLRKISDFCQASYVKCVQSIWRAEQDCSFSWSLRTCIANKQTLPYCHKISSEQLNRWPCHWVAQWVSDLLNLEQKTIHCLELMTSHCLEQDTWDTFWQFESFCRWQFWQFESFCCWQFLIMLTMFSNFFYNFDKLISEAKIGWSNPWSLS